jgi:uncharacterized tellurite resistance protein B-like protein
METIIFDKLMLKTAFCCMASDGDIDEREVDTIKLICGQLSSFIDNNLNEEMNKYVSEINTDSKKFIISYFKTLENSDLSENEEFTLIDIAIKVIKADNIIQYSEIKFFKNIRHRLKVSDEKIIEHFSDVEEIELFLGDDIVTESFLDKITSLYLDTIEFPTFDLINFKT